MRSIPEFLLVAARDGRVGVSSLILASEIAFDVLKIGGAAVLPAALAMEPS